MPAHPMAPTGPNQVLDPLTFSGDADELLLDQTGLANGEPPQAIEFRATSAWTIKNAADGDAYPVLANEPFVVVPTSKSMTIFVTGTEAATLSAMSIGAAS